MRQILETLTRAQELDSAIKSMEEQMARLPSELAAIDSEVSAAEGELAGIKQRRQSLDKNRRALEQQVEEANQNIKKHQRQVFEVKTNKEYTAMLHEIEGEKKKVSEMEEKILALMEEADGLAESERRSTDRADQIRREADAKRAEIKARAQATEAKLAASAAARKSELEGLPPEVLAVYQRVSRGRGGLAVVPMVGGACGGCFANLPTRLTVEVKAMEELVTCEACGRILVWRPEEGLTEAKS
jgi:hypothetical protein